MVDIQTLLPDLRNLAQALAEDLLLVSSQVPATDDRLRNEYKTYHESGHISQSFEEWREDYLEQVAVAWVLACVFVRFIEDNHLIDECWLAGDGDRGKLADGSYELYFRQHPHETDREYLKFVFTEIGKIPAAAELFASTKTPLWSVDPSGDAARMMLTFFKEIDPEVGGLKRSFATRQAKTQPIVEVYEKLAPQAQFLGDLYQDLSEHARKKYALLQTPEFIQQFILDRTLTFAIDEFGLKNLRLIDPACGSGHFLLGAFDRLFEEWLKLTDNKVVAAQNAFDSIYGVDLNPFAIAISRFRLLVAAIQACEIRRIHQQSYAWKLNLAVGDSLLRGCKPDAFGKERIPLSGKQQEFEFDPQPEFAFEDPQAAFEILSQGYHVVVGNPPYITVKDKAANEAYRQRYSTCHQKFSLGVPFTQRFWELAIRQGERIKPDSDQISPSPGYVGMITANSFMKREFGKKLIEDFFPKTDLTHVLDTSGAYIPGHGTPTVILFGRARKPVDRTVRAVFGIKAEPSTPDDPTQGKVWRSILNHVAIAGEQDEYTSSTDVDRSVFARHPWSIGGGGVGEIKEQLEESCQTRLGDLTRSIGVMVVTLEDDAFASEAEALQRHRIAPHNQIGFVEGEAIRDWTLSDPSVALFPYSPDQLRPELSTPIKVWLWPFATGLKRRMMFGKTQLQRGLEWFEYGMLIREKFRSPLSISFAFVATHNHFALDRGGKVFNRSAPVIKLQVDSTEDDHLSLLGLLASSVACFWMKQVMTPKGGGGIGRGIQDEAWETRFEFAATQMEGFPLTNDRPLELARTLDNMVLRTFPWVG